MKVKILIAILAMVALLMFSNNAKAEEVPQQKKETLDQCVQKTILEGYGWSALYGAGVLVVGSGLGMVLAPVSIPTGVVVATLVGESIIGGLIGVGASAVTRISDQERLEINAVAAACKEKEKVEIKNKIRGKLDDLFSQ